MSGGATLYFCTGRGPEELTDTGPALALCNRQETAVKTGVYIVRFERSSATARMADRGVLTAEKFSVDVDLKLICIDFISSINETRNGN